MDAWPKIQAFLASRFRPDLALCDRRFFSWYFRAESGSANMASIWDGERIVGTIGYVPDPLFWGRAGEAVEGAWIVNWIVDPDYRHGVGVALLSAMQKRFPIVLGIGATPENQQIVERLGWAFHDVIPRYIAIFDGEKAASIALPGTTRNDVISRVFTSSTTNADVRAWQPSGPDPDWTSYSGLSFGTIRSNAFLRWRYQQHPSFQYEIAMTGDAARPALAVYRIEDVAGFAPVARVVEFFHSDGDAGTANGALLATALLQRFKERGCAFADCVISSQLFGSTLATAGWNREDVARPLLPSRLQPIERAPFILNLEYGTQKAIVQPGLEQTYVTRGNGDADRPASIMQSSSA